MSSSAVRRSSMVRSDCRTRLLDSSILNPSLIFDTGFMCRPLGPRTIQGTPPHFTTTLDCSLLHFTPHHARPRHHRTPLGFNTVQDNASHRTARHSTTDL